MKVGVIGATGMLGHHTATALMQRGHELVVIHRLGSDLSKIKELSFEARKGDLKNTERLTTAMAGLDAVIHCAGYYPTIPRNWQKDVDLALAQESVFYDACESAKIGKIVYLGGAIALAKAPAGELGHEGLSYARAPANKNPYLQVKWAMDHLAIEKAKAGLPVSIAIPAMTFGEYDYGPTTGRLLLEVANQSLPGYVEGKRNCIYAGDAGRGIAMVCEKGRVGERYLLTGSNTTITEVVGLVANNAKVPVPKKIPLELAKVVAKWQALKYRLFNGDLPKVSDTAIAVMSSGQHLDGKKARDELGFEAKVSLAQAVDQTLSWFRAEGYVA